MSSKRFTVETVPFWLQPLYYPVFFLLGGALYLYWKLILKTCKINIIGAKNLKENPSHIIAVWHRVGVSYWFSRKSGKGYVELAYPIWYMLCPILVMRWSGAEVILGSSGHHGREGADKIVKKLKKEYSTAIAVDGPRGPLYEIKKGVLHMSYQSKKPIIPLEISSSRYFILSRNWDKKRIPLPYSTITMHFKEPIQVTRDNFDESILILEKQLGTKC